MPGPITILDGEINGHYARASFFRPDLKAGPKGADTERG
jgi:hypothetical protein